MVNPIPNQLQQHLLGAGYEIRPELGDTVITQLDSQHFIFVQVRDGKKTYIPITITVPDPQTEIVSSIEVPQDVFTDIGNDSVMQVTTQTDINTQSLEVPLTTDNMVSIHNNEPQEVDTTALLQRAVYIKQKLKKLLS